MSIPSWAVPGAKVVCIDAVPRPDSPSPYYLLLIAEGQIYTISAICADDDVAALFLAEFTTPDPFRIDRFRPLVNEDTEAQLYHEAKKHGKLKSPARPEVNA